MNALLFVLETIGQFLVGIFFIRFALQAARADFHNPLSQAIVKITNPLVMPLRKIIPGYGGLDFASLISAFLIQLAVLAAVLFLVTGGIPSAGGFFIAGFLKFINLILGLYTMLIFLRVIVSWINADPRNPVISMLFSLTEPLLRPFRRWIPPIGGLDISPLVLLLALSALGILINQDLARLLGG